MSSSTIGVGVDDLVTGEAVALELPAAGVAVRAVSGAIDVVATLVLLWAASVAAVLATADSDEAVASTGMLLATVLPLLVLPTTLETLTRGRSLGKLALGLRTVRDDAGPIGFRQALTRALVGVVEIWLLLAIPALLSSLVSARGKRLGDYAAGTYVVRERVSMTIPPPPAMPPELAGWAVGADIARLPDGLAMAVRQFLGRAAGLTPAARAAIGGELQAEVLRHVAPPPPGGSHPELVLAAVIADRRRRDGERLQRNAALRARLMPVDPLAPPDPSAPTDLIAPGDLIGPSGSTPATP
jgi:uncharacterized RDD family membrane protein YckC